MSIGSTIREKRQALGLSVDELAERIGKNRATIYRYESGHIENVPSGILEDLARALHTTPVELLAGGSLPDNIVPLRKANFRPIIGTIACGSPILAEQNFDGYVPVPSDIRCDFCLHCSGNSMVDAGIKNGDLVYIRQQPDVDDGAIAAVLFANESTATLKRVYHGENQITLMPANPSFSPVVVSGEQLKSFRILGLAVAVTSKL